MSRFRLVLVCGVFYFASIFQLGLSDVLSCYACAGPQSDCVASNRMDFLKMDCNNFTVEGKSLIERSSQPDLLEKFDDEVEPRNDQSEIGCVTLTFEKATDSPRDRALKSCIPAKVLDQDVCTYLESLVAEIGGEKTSCHFCKENDCNSGIALSAGKSVTMVVLLVYFCRHFYSC